MVIVGHTEHTRWPYVGCQADIIAASFDSDHEVAPIDVAWMDRVDGSAVSWRFKASAGGGSKALGGCWSC